MCSGVTKWQSFEQIVDEVILCIVEGFHSFVLVGIDLIFYNLSEV